MRELLLSMRIGRILRKVRITEGLTLETFAAQLGISRATLSRIERNNRMDGVTLGKLLRYMLSDNHEEKDVQNT